MYCVERWSCHGHDLDECRVGEKRGVTTTKAMKKVGDLASL